MSRDSLDELTRAGELHRRNLTPVNTIIKLGSIAKEKLLAAGAGPEGLVNHVARRTEPSDGLEPSLDWQPDRVNEPYGLTRCRR